MNELELLIRSFLDRANDGPVEVPEEILEAFGEACKEAFRKQFTGEKRDFTIRMSNVGRPKCQLWMEREGKPAERPPYNHKIKMLYGDLGEAALIAIMQLAGIKVKETQKPVTLDLADGTGINGTLDVIIEENGQDGIYDIKTASAWSFQNKFGRGFEAVAESDTFGYVDQGYGYAKADGKPFKGWIVLNKNDGEIAVCQAPDDLSYQERSYQSAQETARVLRSDEPFQKCFTDEPETFRKKPTGNRVLGTACKFCDYKYSCWPGLQYRPSVKSEAKNPPYNFYTFVDPESLPKEEF